MKKDALIMFGGIRDKDDGTLTLSLIIKTTTVTNMVPLIPYAKQRILEFFESPQFARGCAMTQQELLDLWRSQQK